MPPPVLVLVVPCYNEAARLRPQAWLDFVASHPSVSLMCIDDGSGDGTFELLERMRSASPGSIDVLRLSSHQGKAEAVRAGIVEALGRAPALVGFWDADLSTPLAAVDDVLALANRRPGMDLIIGSRVMLMGRDIRRLAWRHYLGRVFATLVSLALDLPVYDTQCGAKVFRASPAIAAIFASPFQSRWIFDVELLARYLALPVEPGGAPRRARIYELALPAWHHCPGSKLRWTDFVRSAFDLVRIWRVRAARPGVANPESPR
ncbi:MAG: glycosyltransferase [Acidobacteriota bacterium]